MEQFDNLLEIMKKLRSETGCPWDKEQTHNSLKKNLIEETYEAVDAIEKNNKTLLKEELGDVLLQVIFHAQIADEEDSFNIEDVIKGLIDKLVWRHPHVFGTEKAKDSNDVIEKWDDIKKKEKNLEKNSQLLNDVPKSFPSLLRAYKIQSRAAKTGFDWDNVDGVYKKIEEEIKEVKESKTQKQIEEEIGDLIFSVVNLARFLDVEPESALNRSNEKFIKRYTALEIAANNKLKDMTLLEMDEIWEEIKRGEKNEA